MTVGELIANLRRFPPDLNVTSLWDTIPSMPVHGAHLYHDRVVIDCGDGDYGDWLTVLEDEQRMLNGDK